ncbi:hypothetical protein VPHK375_0049 [Vibrio phage K375]
MSRDIKFKYIWKRDTSIATGVYTLEDIENGNCVAPKTKRISLDVIARFQWTGLKDKKGNDIFEGDIIHNSNFEDGCNHVIDMFQELGCWFMTDIKNGYAEQLSEWLDSSVVIGNIHQNPELLK